MSLKRIRLELARDPEFPEGSRERGYEFAAPLDECGRLVPAEWRRARSRCRVTRFRPGDAEYVGHLVWRGGVWVFAPDADDATAEAAHFKLGIRRFIPGEYVAFSEPNGIKRTFRVARVADLE
jgi:hypothetical protein